MSRTRKSWAEAPSWATVLLKNRVVKDVYVFAESFKQCAKAWPSVYNSKECFPLAEDLWEIVENRPVQPESIKENKPEDSGGSCDYYKVLIENPTTEVEQYTAECNDVIESLNMTYAEANVFKEIWRSAAARTLGKLKAGNNEVRGAEKIVFFAQRNAILKGVKQ